MADIIQVEQLFRFLKTPVTQTKDGDFVIDYNNVKFKLTNVDVDEYFKVKANMESPVPTAIHIPSWFEQAVDVQGRGPMTYRLFRGNNEIALEDKTQTRRVVLSPASTMFVLAQLDSDQIQMLHRFISFFRLRFRQTRNSDDSQLIPLNELLNRILTIKVSTTPGDLLARNPGKLKSIAEASLFHIAYGQGIGISLSLSWERAYYRLGLRRDSSVQFPLRTYSSELLAYYHLALGSESLIMTYLALYKVLEYFFTSSSDRLLHQKMTEKLVEPDFSHTKSKKMQELARIIRIHDSKLDERRLLRTVIEHYFDVEELRNWITTFNTDNDNYLTTERDVFAEQVKVDTSDDQIFASIANRIYHIRNALVHYKEGEISRFIPFSGQEAILYRELPLLLHLAEQVIIKTGKDLQ